MTDVTPPPPVRPVPLDPKYRGRIGQVRRAAKVVETLGWRWAATRLYLEAEHRSGVLKRRTPLSGWDDHPVEGDLTMRPVTIHTEAAGDFLRRLDPEVEAGLRDHLERLKGGEFDIFGTWCRLDSWHAEPITPASYPPERHWSEVDELPEADLKLVWEPSRFSWAFHLARLHAIDPDTPAPDLFWELFESWCGENQPHAGVNWKCGQESAIRLMAVTFAVNAFGPRWLSPERERLLAAFAQVTAERILAHWRYAKSQDNNHIVSEAVGLITVALTFPGLAIAGRARKLGEKLLAEACERLVFPDGGTSQYSLNYHRVFMENFIWAIWLYRSVEETPPRQLVTALRRTNRFLVAITQRSDGAAGNWGNNDGAHLLPLTSTRFLDVRSTIMMAATILHGAPYHWGEEAEEAVWWFWGPPNRFTESPPEPVGPHVEVFPFAGISIVINGRDRALVRGGPYQLFRPPQCDFGNVELWEDGVQTVFDPGTWSYKPRGDEPDFTESKWHNGPHPEGGEQMTRLTRFLWGDWPDVEERHHLRVTPADGTGPTDTIGSTYYYRRSNQP